MGGQPLRGINISLALNSGNLIKVLVPGFEVPLTSLSRVGLPSPRFNTCWFEIRERVRNFGENGSQHVDIPPIFQGDLTLKLFSKAEPSAIKRKGKKIKVLTIKKPRSKGKEDSLTLSFDEFLSTLGNAKSRGFNVKWLKSRVIALRDLKRAGPSIHASLSLLQELRVKRTSCINKVKKTKSAIEAHSTSITQLQECITKVQEDLSSKQEASSTLQTQLKGIEVEQDSLNKEIN
nr:hypothetical protein CFP56_35564 [Quercus suber]